MIFQTKYLNFLQKPGTLSVLFFTMLSSFIPIHAQDVLTEQFSTDDKPLFNDTGIEWSSIAPDNRKAMGQARKNARKAVHKIKKCFKHSGLTKQSIYKIALFIETELPKKVAENGIYYFSRAETKLARTIEVDPQSKKIFIHLKQHGIKELGRGARKSVTYSILYSNKKPKKVAHSHTTYPNENEAQANIDLKDGPGIYKIISVLADSRDESPNKYSFVSKYYPLGDFDNYLKTCKKRLKFRDRFRFCRDIMTGIQSLHNKGYAHRDLGFKNYFAEKRNKKVRLLVADFGRATQGGNTEEKGAQGGYSLCAPEGLDYDSLSGDDYLRTDIFALGCCFYKILYNKKPGWMNPEQLKDSSIPLYERQNHFKETIECFKKHRTKQLKAICRRSKKRFSPARLEQIILKMIDPDPSLRPTANSVCRMLDDMRT